MGQGTEEGTICLRNGLFKMFPLGAASSTAESSLTRPLVFSDSQLLEPVGKWELPLGEQSAPANAYVNNADAGSIWCTSKKGSKIAVRAPPTLKIKSRGGGWATNVKLSSQNIYSQYL